MAAEKNRPARTVVRGKLRIVNQPVSKVDAHALVTGKAVYTNDLAPADCLVVKVLRSPYAHALIKDINTARAEAVPGQAFYNGRTDLSGAQPVRQADP